MQFKEFKQAIVDKFNKMVNEDMTLCRVQLPASTKEIIELEDGELKEIKKHAVVETYLDSFTDADEQQHHNCNCCKSFLRQHANIVGVDKNMNLHSIWDVTGVEQYQAVTDNLAAFVKALPIERYFMSNHQELGTAQSLWSEKHNEVFNHFSLNVPNKFINSSCDTLDTVLSQRKAIASVLNRSLETITDEAINLTLELIEENELPNGASFKNTIEKFKELKQAYNKLKKAEQKEHFAWYHATRVHGSVAGIRNVSIGTFLVDLSEGLDLAEALRKWDSVMSPHNYRRTTVPATKKQREEAKQFLEEGGYMDSIHRRFANKSDISVNDVLWANRTTKSKLKDSDPFAILDEKERAKVGKLKDCKDIGIEDFMKTVLPEMTSLELLLESRLQGNLCSIVTAKHAGSKKLFKWDNNASWVYNGNLANSVKQRVKDAGGKVDGIIRISLAWTSACDLDLHCVRPNGQEIFFREKGNYNTGKLDLDMNGMDKHDSVAPVENITWTNASTIEKGTYTVYVNNYNNRLGNSQAGFTVEIECNDKIYYFNHPNNNVKRMEMFRFKWDGKDISIVSGNISSSGGASHEIWGINTQEYHECNVVCTTPNYWEEHTVGTKHYMFVLDKCVNPDTPSGFFNEYLKDEFREHKRSMEMLGGLMTCEHTTDQLSGLAFNTTLRENVIVRATVKGVEKHYKINF